MKIHNANHGKSMAKEVVIYTDEDIVSCSGEHNDHPKVYITVPGVCGYCDIKFKKNFSLHFGENVV